MNNEEATLLSSLAMLKVSDNITDAFDKAEESLDGAALAAAKAIRYNIRTDDVARSMLEWAEEEQGLVDPETGFTLER